MSPFSGGFAAGCKGGLAVWGVGNVGTFNMARHETVSARPHVQHNHPSPSASADPKAWDRTHTPHTRTPKPAHAPVLGQVGLLPTEHLAGCWQHLDVSKVGVVVVVTGALSAQLACRGCDRSDQAGEHANPNMHAQLYLYRQTKSMRFACRGCCRFHKGGITAQIDMV